MLAYLKRHLVTMCCRGGSALCVVADIQFVVMSCCVRHRMAETSGISIWEREWRLFCLLPQVCDVICSLVRLSVSENSSVAPCGCVMAGTSRGLRGVAETTTRMTPALIINVLCRHVSKVATPQGTADVLYWMSGGGRCLSNYRQSVVDIQGVCLRGLGIFLSLNLKWCLLSNTKKISHVRWWR